MGSSAANLYPELLLALVGHTGEAFVRREPHGIVLSDAVVDWVTPPEREQLNRLALLGAHFAALEEFVAGELAAGDSSGQPPSLYRAALAHGVSELLDVYRSAVLRVEAHLLHLPAPPPLLSVQHFLLEFEALLPEVAALAGQVRRQGLAGSGVMRALELRARSGAPALQSCAARLLWHCRQVLLKQLESWLVHGLLLDPAAEFFVRRREPGGGATPTPRSHPAGSQPPPGACLDWQPLEWHSGFTVAEGELPPGVSPPAAEAVLFIGKAVRALKQPMSAAVSAQALAAHARVLGFSDALRSLQREQEFSPARFELCVERMRAQVSTLLWELVRHRCDLAGQLEAVRAYLLLGRGDFYQQFLDEAAPLLAREPKPNTAEADIALAFQQSALKSTAEADPLFGAFALRWLPPDAAAGAAPAGHPLRCTGVAAPRYDAWDGLYLECAVDWPLQLLFPPEVMAQYGALWQHLLRVRRAQLALEGSWAALQALQRRRPEHGGPLRLPAALRAGLCAARMEQHHFLSNLWRYLAVDVVEASFGQLRAAVAAAPDFSAADAAHRRCVASLVSQCFLDMRQLVGFLEDMLLQCRALCQLVQRLAQRGEEADVEAAGRALGGIRATFRSRQRVLFQVMQSGKLSARAPALRQLVSRLNFNGVAEAQARHDAAA